MQGLAFLTKYRDLRGEDVDNADEVEYNFGRAFHQLGLLTLAAKHYTRVLEIVEQRMQATPEVCSSVVPMSVVLTVVVRTMVLLERQHTTSPRSMSRLVPHLWRNLSIVVGSRCES